MATEKCVLKKFTSQEIGTVRSIDFDEFKNKGLTLEEIGALCLLTVLDDSDDIPDLIEYVSQEEVDRICTLFTKFVQMDLIQTLPEEE